MLVGVPALVLGVYGWESARVVGGSHLLSFMAVHRRGRTSPSYRLHRLRGGPSAGLRWLAPQPDMFRKSLRKSQLEGLLLPGEGADAAGSSPLDPRDFAVLKDIADDLLHLLAEAEAQGVPGALFKDKLCPSLVEQWWRERRQTETQTGLWAWRVIKNHFLDWPANANKPSDVQRGPDRCGDTGDQETVDCSEEEEDDVSEDEEEESEEEEEEDSSPVEAPGDPEDVRRRRVVSLLEACSVETVISVLQVEFAWPRIPSQKELLSLERSLAEKLAELQLDGRSVSLGHLRRLGACARFSGGATEGTLFAATVCAGQAPPVAVLAIVPLLEALLKAEAAGFSARTYKLGRQTGFRALRACLRAFTPVAADAGADAAAPTPSKRLSIGSGAYRPPQRFGGSALLGAELSASPSDSGPQSCARA